jgi:hypothetical protein
MRPRQALIELSGYDTGQISDILLMPDFLQRFGNPDGAGGYSFSNWKEGLIVGLLSIGTLIGEPAHLQW